MLINTDTEEVENELLHLSTSVDFCSPLPPDSFDVFYQPILDLQSHGRNPCVGAEALVRFRQENKIYPASAFFDEMKNDPCFRAAISRFVVSRALEDLAYLRSSIFFHLNLFSEDLLNDSFLDWFFSLVASSPVDRSKLIIEIPELGDDTGLGDIIYLIRRQGMGVALDDLGQHESNVSRLFFYPDMIKIDRFFCPSDLNPDALKGLLVCLFGAQLFNCKAILEGIESEHQLKIAQSLGVEYGQGYYWSRAIPFHKLRRDFL